MNACIAKDILTCWCICTIIAFTLVSKCEFFAYTSVASGYIFQSQRVHDDRISRFFDNRRSWGSYNERSIVGGGRILVIVCSMIL